MGQRERWRVEYEEIIDNLRCFSHPTILHSPANVPYVSLYLFLIAVPALAAPATFFHINQVS